jgi:prephenate dehydrogenase
LSGSEADFSPPAAAPFASVAIVGLGLIGGSVAMGLRRAWPDVRIVGVDRPEIASAARERGAVDDVRERAVDLPDVELIVLATPVPRIVELLGVLDGTGTRALVTDVGSTKRHVAATAAGTGLRFVGGHPIAGAATAGLAHARADLFERREWMLVPGTAPDADVAALERLIAGLGARPRRMEADAHDRVMAYVSHLPQLLATALMTTAGDAVGRDGLAAAGPGFGDMTRLASSPADIWKGIVATNADYIAEAITALAAALPACGGGTIDPRQVEALFQRANSWTAAG